MYTWKRLDAGGHPHTDTYSMEVPGGQVIQTVTEARDGRGPGSLASASPFSTALVFVPHEEPGQ